MTQSTTSAGDGTPQDPWRLKTPPLTSDFTMHRDTRDGREVLVCTVGKTVLLYDARCIDDLHAMLAAHGARQLREREDVAPVLSLIHI